MEACSRPSCGAGLSVSAAAVNPIPLAGRVAVIVDDGFATGATAKAACQAARAKGARRVVLAAPVGAADVVEVLRSYADEVVCLETPEFYFFARRPGLPQIPPDLRRRGDRTARSRPRGFPGSRRERRPPTRRCAMRKSG